MIEIRNNKNATLDDKAQIITKLNNQIINMDQQLEE